MSVDQYPGCKYNTKKGYNQILLISFIPGLFACTQIKKLSCICVYLTFILCSKLNCFSIMIQRIQSLYLVAVILICVSLFFLPISSRIIPANPAGGVAEGVSFKMDLTGISKYGGNRPVAVSSNYVLLALNVALGLLAMAIIFMYSKRVLQMKLTRFGVILASAFIAVDFYFSDAMGKEYGDQFKTMYLIGSYLYVLQIVFLLLALRAIKKDQDLVQSADRIR